MTKYPLQVSQISQQHFSGSPLIIERQLRDSANYQKFIVSYSSDGLKIFALLTIPIHPITATTTINASHQKEQQIYARTLGVRGQPAKQSNRFPLVIFNRGYVDPEDYQTDRQYLRYLDHFARNGFVIFKSDYRGIGESEGESQSVTSSANAADVLNGIASLGSISQIDFDKCFIWGHSMGAMISLQILLVPSTNIPTHPKWRAGSLWAGFIIPYDRIIKRWQNSNDKQRQRAEDLLQTYGDPQLDPTPWQEISPYYFLDQLPCPIQLHHGARDTSIPDSDSVDFEEQLKKVGQSGGLFIYPEGDHNLSGPQLDQAMAETIKFFRSKL